MANTITALFKSVTIWFSVCYNSTAPASAQTFFKTIVPYMTPTKWSRTVQALTAGGVLAGIAWVYFKYLTTKTTPEGSHKTEEPPTKKSDETIEPEPSNVNQEKSDVVEKLRQALGVTAQALKNARKEFEKTGDELFSAEETQRMASGELSTAETRKWATTKKHKEAVADLQKAESALCNIDATNLAAKGLKLYAEADFIKAERECKTVQAGVEEAQKQLTSAENQHQITVTLVKGSREESNAAKLRVTELEKTQQTFLAMDRSLEDLRASWRKVNENYTRAESLVEQLTSANAEAVKIQEATKTAANLKAQADEADDKVDQYVLSFNATKKTFENDMKTAKENFMEKLNAESKAVNSLDLDKVEVSNKKWACEQVNIKLRQAEQTVKDVKERVEEALQKALEAEKPEIKQAAADRVREAEENVALQKKAVEEATRNKEAAEKAFPDATQAFEKIKENTQAAEKKKEEAYKKIAPLEAAMTEAVERWQKARDDSIQ